jgi:hypothetical protein
MPEEGKKERKRERERGRKEEKFLDIVSRNERVDFTAGLKYAHGA